MSNETNWTPGPWYFVESTAYPSVRSMTAQGRRGKDKGVVTMYRSDAEHAANAHLIAAAPELYEALDYVMTAHGEQLSDAFAQAQEALAKARGES